MKRKDLQEFIEYLKEQFPESIKDEWTVKLIKNLIDYAYRTHGHSKGSAKGIIYGILPDVDINEIEKRLPDFDEWEPEEPITA